MIFKRRQKKKKTGSRRYARLKSYCLVRYQKSDELDPKTARVVNARDIVPRTPPVFLPTILSFFVSVAPIPYQKWIGKFLEKFIGYVHHGDMRYLTRTKDERSERYEDVKLLANPNMIHRAVWWVKGVWRKPTSPIDDHNINIYCKKLKVYALGRIDI